jgi:hypothetical protein
MESDSRRVHLFLTATGISKFLEKSHTEDENEIVYLKRSEMRSTPIYHLLRDFLRKFNKFDKTVNLEDSSKNRNDAQDRFAERVFGEIVDINWHEKQTLLDSVHTLAKLWRPQPHPNSEGGESSFTASSQFKGSRPESKQPSTGREGKSFRDEKIGRGPKGVSPFDDVLIYQAILLALLLSTAVDNSDVLNSGVSGQIVPFL